MATVKSIKTNIATESSDTSRLNLIPNFSPLCAETSANATGYIRTSIRTDEVDHLSNAGYAVLVISKLLRNSAIEKCKDDGAPLNGFYEGGLFAAMELIGGELAEMGEKLHQQGDEERKAEVGHE